MLVIRSSRTHVHENLAAEDVLLDEDSLTEPVLLIYINQPAVVIGKNQNPWRECSVPELNRRGISLARRISGGGAVFHDPGNLNFSLIVPRSSYRREETLGLFVDGLAALDIHAEIVGTSLAVGGKKISGHAFCYRRDKVLHHGTLLWDTDLDTLGNALKPECPDITTRAVASVRMPVVNLSRLMNDQATPARIESCLIRAFAAKWGDADAAVVSPFDSPGYAARLARMQSWDWRFGTTPDFACVFRGHAVQVHRGLIQTVDGETRHAWVGRRFPPSPKPRR